MLRELHTSQLASVDQVEPSSKSIRRTQRNQVNALIRMAQRLGRQVDHQGLNSLIQSFQTFADEYAAALDNANQSGQLPFLLHSGTERLLQEWDILSRACEQRKESLDDRRMVAEQGNVGELLKMADDRLAGFCARWRPPASAAYVSLQTPVVYFEKLYRISRALFAPGIPVVSIPLSDYDAPDRWQALAHEMGHHVFWNAVTVDEFSGLQTRLRQAVGKAVLERFGVTDYSSLDKSPLLARLDLWGHWLEEVFADICGVLFAGPAFAHSAQELAAASINTLDDLVGADDQAHPSLYLRPLIALQVLREMAQQLIDRNIDPNYAQALLAWAGTGELETQRRAPGFDDFLKTIQIPEQTRTKRIPADLVVSSDMILTGDLRWRLFTAEAAAKPYPSAQVPLADLAADVPGVVHTVLSAPVWPEGKRLWDLVDFYGLVKDERTILELDALAWKALPDISQPPVFPPLPDLKSAPDTDVTGVMRRIEAGLVTAQVEEDQKPRMFWTLLSALDVESETAGYHKHTDSESNHKHDAWWFLFTSLHHHDPAGQNVYPG